MLRIVRNALICDGSGAEPFSGSVAFDGPVISEVVAGEISGTKSAEVFDAQGCVLSPGFIDAHSHSDATLAADPDAFSKRISTASYLSAESPARRISSITSLFKIHTKKRKRSTTSKT